MWEIPIDIQVQPLCRGIERRTLWGYFDKQIVGELRENIAVDYNFLSRQTKLSALLSIEGKGKKDGIGSCTELLRNSVYQSKKPKVMYKLKSGEKDSIYEDWGDAQLADTIDMEDTRPMIIEFPDSSKELVWLRRQVGRRYISEHSKFEW